MLVFYYLVGYSESQKCGEVSNLVINVQYSIFVKRCCLMWVFFHRRKFKVSSGKFNVWQASAGFKVTTSTSEVIISTLRGVWNIHYAN